MYYKETEKLKRLECEIKPLRYGLEQLSHELLVYR